MSAERPPAISITLSPTQVQDVVRAALHSRPPSLSTMLADRLEVRTGGAGAEATAQLPGAGSSPPAAAWTVDDADPRLSRSLLRGLSILTRFGGGSAERGIVELAGELGMSPSTAHRYAQTLVELGLLERCPRTRKYRLPAR